MLALALASAVVGRAAPADEPSLADLKARVANASPRDRVHLCVRISQKQLEETDKFYASGDLQNAQNNLTDVVAYAELARDYSIQSHKDQKQTEIAVRAMTRKLTGILHSLGTQEQIPVKDAIKRLERVRDDLLASLFKKGSS